VIYAFLALRRVYGQGLPATLGKLLLLMLGYAVALVMTMVGTFVATVAAL
jgi:hypothetical protein